MEGATAEWGKNPTGAVVELAHPLNEVETGCVDARREQTKCESKGLNEKEKNSAKDDFENSGASCCHHVPPHHDGDFCDFDTRNSNAHDPEV
jgi:hypothetical protein